MDRKEDFKTGLGNGENAIERHIEKRNGIRKQKREDKLARIRHVAVDITGFQNALKTYKPMELYQRTNVGALDALNTCMRLGTDDQLNKHFTYLLAYSDKQGSPVVQTLIQLLGENNPDIGLKAMSCLVNLSGANLEPQYQPLLAQLIIEAGFLNAATAHITEDSIVAKECWCVVSNLISLCETSRDVVLSCILFKNIHKDENWSSPFLTEMQKGRSEYDVLIFTVVCGAFETGSISLPDPAFCFATLMFSIKYIMMHWHPGRSETTSNPDRVLELVLSALAHFANKCSSQNKDHIILFARIFGQAEEKMQGFSYLINLASRVKAANQHRLARVFVKAGKFNDPSLTMQRLMYKSGCVQLMIGFVESVDPKLQREALMWLGNYAADSLEFVLHIREQGGFRSIAQRLRSAQSHALRNAAVYCLMQACNVSSAYLPNEQASSCLIHLVTDCRIIQITCRHINDTGDPQLTIDILELWLTLLRWKNKHLNIANIIEEYGGDDKVERLLGITGEVGMRIFKLAESVLNNLNGARTVDMEVYDTSHKGRTTFYF